MIATADVIRALPRWHTPRWRPGWTVKAALAAAVAVTADILFDQDVTPGSTLGLFAAALLAALALSRRGRDVSALEVAAWSAGWMMALALLDSPNPLACVLLWCALVTISLARLRRIGGAGQWFRLGLAHSIGLWAAPLADIGILSRLRRRRMASVLRGLRLLIVPVALGLVFLALFAAANPLLDSLLARLDLAAVMGGVALPRLLLWLVSFTAVYGLARWRWRLRRRPAGPMIPAATVAAPRPDTWLTAGSVTWSLAAFNLLFALQNVSDLAFLWSGAALPEGFTFADYAHRGAYPLIATALLAAGFVLVALRPGSATAADRTVRLLVLAWIGQNAFLTLSAMLRTLDYVDAYSLTLLRLSALLWMALVALGLVLVIVRVARGMTNGWLVDANVIAATVLLAGCAVADLRGFVADYNARHCAEIAGKGPALDTYYLASLGAPALPAMAWLQQQPIGDGLKGAVALHYDGLVADLRREQAAWRSWTFHGHRILALVEEKALLVSVHQLPNDEPEPYTSASPLSASGNARP